MAEFTEIAWTDSTFNPWWGCTKVGPGCDFCYAEELDSRTSEKSHWGAGNMPRTMSIQNWNKPLRWEKDAVKNNTRRRVFCGSMCDVFDKNAPAGERDRLWNLIKLTPHLDWQLLTKRAVNINKYLPEDWGNGYDNVWLGVTCENISHGIPRIDILRDIPAKVRFLSIEPLLENLGPINLNGIDWVIVGGESGPYARKMEEEWVTNIERQCYLQNTPFFFKQWGGKVKKGGCLLNNKEIKQWPEISIYS